MKYIIAFLVTFLMGCKTVGEAFGFDVIDTTPPGTEKTNDLTTFLFWSISVGVVAVLAYLIGKSSSK